MSREYLAKRAMHTYSPERRSLIILVHPRKDEVSRRRLLAGGYGSDEFGWDAGVVDSLWSDCHESSCPEDLKSSIIQTLCSAAYPAVDTSEPTTAVYKLIQDKDVAPILSDEVAERTGGLAMKNMVPALRVSPIRHSLAKNIVEQVLSTNGVMLDSLLANAVIKIYTDDVVSDELLELISA